MSAYWNHERVSFSEGPCAVVKSNPYPWLSGGFVPPGLFPPQRQPGHCDAHPAEHPPASSEGSGGLSAFGKLDRHLSIQVLSLLDGAGRAVASLVCREWLAVIRSEWPWRSLRSIAPGHSIHGSAAPGPASSPFPDDRRHLRWLESADLTATPDLAIELLGLVQCAGGLRRLSVRFNRPSAEALDAVAAVAPRLQELELDFVSPAAFAGEEAACTEAMRRLLGSCGEVARLAVSGGGEGAGPGSPAALVDDAGVHALAESAGPSLRSLHLISAFAPTLPALSALLARCPSLTCLSFSRQRFEPIFGSSAHPPESEPRASSPCRLPYPAYPFIGSSARVEVRAEELGREAAVAEAVRILESIYAGAFTHQASSFRAAPSFADLGGSALLAHCGSPMLLHRASVDLVLVC
eukprot:tig00000076_g2392.t1